jgi:hypothetical protein
MIEATETTLFHLIIDTASRCRGGRLPPLIGMPAAGRGESLQGEVIIIFSRVISNHYTG